MSNIRAIRTEADYEAALVRVGALMDAEFGTPEGDELDVLTDLVGLYESQHVAIGYPSPIGAIRFRMEQGGLSPRDLVPLIGSRAKVSELLSGKRPLSMQMARALHANLGIPADVLLQQPGGELPSALEGIDWQRFPLAAMAKLGWITKRARLRDHAEVIMRDLIRRAGGDHVLPAALYRNNDPSRANAKSDAYALRAWCWEVLARANAAPLPAAYRAGKVNLKFLRKVATLSWRAEGPRLAQDFLAKHGIHLVCVEHLPRTHLDGAVLQLADGTPVIGMTLRYDRLDNFWFCLLHELAHIGRHMDGKREVAFIDDLSLRDVEGVRRDPKDVEADEWALEALIPDAAWQTSHIQDHPSPLAVIELRSSSEFTPRSSPGASDTKRGISACFPISSERARYGGS